MKKRGVPLALYLIVCLAIIVSAYFHLSRIAQNFNTQQLELITGLYAEKMNESMEYLQNYVKEDVKMIADLTLATGEKVHLSASAGGAAFPEQGEDFISLCRSADAALYNVKQNGKGAFKIK